MDLASLPIIAYIVNKGACLGVSCGCIIGLLRAKYTADIAKERQQSNVLKERHKSGRASMLSAPLFANSSPLTAIDEAGGGEFGEEVPDLADARCRFLGDMSDKLDEKAFLRHLKSLVSEAKYLQNDPEMHVVPEEWRAAQLVRDELDCFAQEGYGPLVIREYGSASRPNLSVVYRSQAEIEGSIAFAGVHFDVAAVPEPRRRTPFPQGCCSSCPVGRFTNPFKLDRQQDTKLIGWGTSACLGHVALLTQFLIELARAKPKLKHEIVVFFFAGREGGEADVGADKVLQHLVGEETDVLADPRRSNVFWFGVGNSGLCYGSTGHLSWTLQAVAPNERALELINEALSYLRECFEEKFPPHPAEGRHCFTTSSKLKPRRIESLGGPQEQEKEATTAEAHGEIYVTPFYSTDDVIKAMEELVEQINAEINVALRPGRKSSRLRDIQGARQTTHVDVKRRSWAQIVQETASPNKDDKPRERKRSLQGDEIREALEEVSLDKDEKETASPEKTDRESRRAGTDDFLNDSVEGSSFDRQTSQQSRVTAASADMNESGYLESPRGSSRTVKPKAKLVLSWQGTRMDSDSDDDTDIDSDDEEAAAERREEKRRNAMRDVSRIAHDMEGIAVDLESPAHQALKRALTSARAVQAQPFTIRGCVPHARNWKNKGFDVQLSGFGVLDRLRQDGEYCDLNDMLTGYKVLMNIVCDLEEELGQRLAAADEILQSMEEEWDPWKEDLVIIPDSTGPIPTADDAKKAQEIAGAAYTMEMPLQSRELVEEDEAIADDTWSGYLWRVVTGEPVDAPKAVAPKPRTEPMPHLSQQQWNYYVAAKNSPYPPQSLQGNHFAARGHIDFAARGHIDAARGHIDALRRGFSTPAGFVNYLPSIGEAEVDDSFQLDGLGYDSPRGDRSHADPLSLMDASMMQDEGDEEDPFAKPLAELQNALAKMQAQRASRLRNQQAAEVVEPEVHVADGVLRASRDGKFHGAESFQEPDDLVQPFSVGGDQAIVKEVHEVYNVTLERDEDSKLGVNCSCYMNDGEVPLIEIAAVTGGLVAKWNEDYPSAEVQPGDRIVSVNGTQGDFKQMWSALEKKSGVVQMTLRRSAPLARKAAGVGNHEAPTVEKRSTVAKQNVTSGGEKELIEKDAEQEVQLAEVGDPPGQRETSPTRWSMWSALPALRRSKIMDEVPEKLDTEHSPKTPSTVPMPTALTKPKEPRRRPAVPEASREPPSYGSEQSDFSDTKGYRSPSSNPFDPLQQEASPPGVSKTPQRRPFYEGDRQLEGRSTAGGLIAAPAAKAPGQSRIEASAVIVEPTRQLSPEVIDRPDGARTGRTPPVRNVSVALEDKGMPPPPTANETGESPVSDSVAAQATYRSKAPIPISPDSASTSVEELAQAEASNRGGGQSISSQKSWFGIIVPKTRFHEASTVEAPRQGGPPSDKLDEWVNGDNLAADPFLVRDCSNSSEAPQPLTSQDEEAFTKPLVTGNADVPPNATKQSLTENTQSTKRISEEDVLADDRGARAAVKKIDDPTGAQKPQASQPGQARQMSLEL